MPSATITQITANDFTDNTHWKICFCILGLSKCIYHLVFIGVIIAKRTETLPSNGD